LVTGFSAQCNGHQQCIEVEQSTSH